MELAGILYHVGENDMSWGPYRKASPERVVTLVQQTRVDLERPQLKWFVSQQPPTDDERGNKIDVTAAMQEVLSEDPHVVHLQLSDLPPQEKLLVIDTSGIVWLGECLAESFLNQQSAN